MSSRKCEDWIESYMEYTVKSEAPDSYHTWTAVAVIAAALRRQVWIDMGYFTIYPNMYVVLVGPPGTRKNRAINIGIDLLKRVPDIHFGAELITREALILAIEQSKMETVMPDNSIYIHSSLTVVSKELSVFLGRDNQEFLAVLTDLYDNHDMWEYRTKNKGNNKIVGEWLNILGGSTPAWLVGSVSMKAIGAGFTSRVIFVVEDEPRYKDAFPFLTMKEVAIKELLVHDLERISQIKGRYTLTDEAISFFKNWYENTPTNVHASDVRFEGYFERKHIHLLKLSVILSACRSDDMVVSEIDVKRGLYILDHLEDNMVRAFGSAGRSVMPTDIDEVIKLFKKRKELSRDQLMNTIWRDVDYRMVDSVLSAILRRWG